MVDDNFVFTVASWVVEATCLHTGVLAVCGTLVV